MRTTMVAATLLLVAVPAFSPAGEPDTLRGRHVRIQVEPPAEGRSRVEGRVRASDGDGLVLDTGDAAILVPWSSVGKIEVVAHRSRGCGVLRGTGVGFLSGAVLGAAIGAGNGDRLYSSGAMATVGAMIYGSMGAGVGALVGVAAPCTTWEVADRARFTIEPERRGVGARLSVRF